MPTPEELPPDDRPFGVRGGAEAQLNEWRGHRYVHGRPAWAAPPINVPDASRQVPQPLNLLFAVEAMAAALYDIGPDVRHPKKLREWIDEDLARPGYWAMLGAAERAGLNLEALCRLAGVALNSTEPIDEAIRRIVEAVESGETVRTSGEPVTAARPRKRKAGRGRAEAQAQADADASQAAHGSGQATGDATPPPLEVSPIERPPGEVVTEHWENKYFECLAALMRVAPDISPRAPFSGWDERCAEDPSLPTFAGLLYTTRRYGTTPRLLMAFAREKVAAGEPPPEPVRRELVLRQVMAVGDDAIAQVLARPFTPADLRCATYTWPLNECLDAMIDAIPDLPPSAEFGHKSGWHKLEGGRDDIPTYPTLLACCDAHGLTVHELMAAARAARAGGRGFRPRDR